MGGDYQALQPMDVPMTADTSVAVPELTRICRELAARMAAARALPNRG